MKKTNTNKKWILLLGYVLIFPLALQISFMIKKYIGTPMYDYVDKALHGYQLFPIYTIVTSFLASLFIAFIIIYSRKIASLFAPGMLLPIGIVAINIVAGIPMSSLLLTKLSYYFNSYDTHFLYTTLCILLPLLIIDSQKHKTQTPSVCDKK